MDLFLFINYRPGIFNVLLRRPNLHIVQLRKRKNESNLQNRPGRPGYISFISGNRKYCSSCTDSSLPIENKKKGNLTMYVFEAVFGIYGKDDEEDQMKVIYVDTCGLDPQDVTYETVWKNAVDQALRMAADHKEEKWGLDSLALIAE